MYFNLPTRETKIDRHNCKIREIIVVDSFTNDILSVACFYPGSLPHQMPFTYYGRFYKQYTKKLVYVYFTFIYSFLYVKLVPLEK